MLLQWMMEWSVTNSLFVCWVAESHDLNSVSPVVLYWIYGDEICYERDNELQLGCTTILVNIWRIRWFGALAYFLTWWAPSRILTVLYMYDFTVVCIAGAWQTQWRAILETTFSFGASQIEGISSKPQKVPLHANWSRIPRVLINFGRNQTATKENQGYSMN